MGGQPLYIRRKARAFDPDATTRPGVHGAGWAKLQEARLETVGSHAALGEIKSAASAAVPAVVAADRRRDWMTRPEVCLHLGIRPATLYRMVSDGQVHIARDGDTLRYRLAAPLAGDPPATPGPAEEAAERHDSDAYVAALAAFVDELSERLRNAERDRQAAQHARTEALSRVREATDEHLALTRQHVEATQRMRRFEDSLTESQRALYDVRESELELRDRLEKLAAGLARVTASPWALPLRRQLRSLVSQL